MKIYFSPLFDLETWPHNYFLEDKVAIGQFNAGPKKLLDLLELHLGLRAKPVNDNFRILQYAKQLKINAAGTFFEDSLKVNDIDVAKTLLQWRDELVLAGWNFKTTSDCPRRLQDLAKVEEFLQMDAGEADRWQKVIKLLKRADPKRHLPISEILVHEPGDYLPPFFKKLFRVLEDNYSISIRTKKRPAIDSADTDLEALKTFILGEKKTGRKKLQVKNDGSLQVQQFPTILSAARAYAYKFSVEPGYQPVIINEHSDASLSLEMKYSGLPSLGQGHTCGNDPDLQLLAVLPLWLWQPWDAEKILSFLLAPVNILPFKVCRSIAADFCQSPGVRPEKWLEELSTWVEDFNINREEDSPELTIDKWQKVLNFLWSYEQVRETFTREELIKYFAFLETAFGEIKTKNQQRRAKAKKISAALGELVDLISLSPAAEYNQVQLDQLIQLVVGSYCNTFHEKERNSLCEIERPAALVSNTDEVLWFGCYQEESSTSIRSQWTLQEQKWLKNKEVHLQSAEQLTRAAFFYLTDWVRFVNKSLTIVVPAVVNGKETQPHSFMAFINGCFEDPYKLTSVISTPADLFEISTLEETATSPVPRLPMNWEVDRKIGKRLKPESFSSLDKLIKYPYQWVLEYIAKLKNYDSLCLPGLFAFYGSLSHSIFQQLLTTEGIMDMNEQQLKRKYSEVATQSINNNGLLLFKKGEEKKLKQFREHLFESFYSLLKLLKDNNWVVVAYEMEDTKNLGGEEVLGKCDLLLQKNNQPEERAIIDLKYSGMKYRDLMAEGKDLQLAIYSAVFSRSGSFCPTAYFIIDAGLLFTTDINAFRGAIDLSGEDDMLSVHEGQLQLIKEVVEIRRTQLRNGVIEVGENVSTDDLGLPPVFNEILPLSSGCKQPSVYNDYKTFVDTE